MSYLSRFGSLCGVLLLFVAPVAAVTQTLEERRAEADEIIERYAIEQHLKRHTEMDGEEAIKQAVEEILRESGVHESQALEIVTRAVLDEVPGGEMAQAIHDGDIGGFSRTVAGKTAEVLDRLADDPDSDTHALLVEALGADAQITSDPRVAMEALSMQIIENTPYISTLATIWGTGRDVIDDTIDVWADAEVQEAFEVYRDGSADSDRFTGVNPGDWDAIMLQMGGIEWRLRSEAVAAYAERQGIGVREVEYETRRALAEQTLDRLRSGFDERIEREQVVPRIEASTREVIAHIGRVIGGDPDLLIRAESRNPLYRDGAEDSVDFMLGRVFGALTEVERIAGQSTVTDQTAIDRTALDGGIERLSSLAAAQAVRAWLEAPGDQKDAAVRDVLTQTGVIADVQVAPPEEERDEALSEEDIMRMFEGIADDVEGALPAVRDEDDWERLPSANDH